MIKKRILLIERKLFESDTKFSNRVNSAINDVETLTPPLEISAVSPLVNTKGKLKGITLYLQSDIEEKEKREIGFYK